ncbi:MAG: PAS-domain containing protein [Proteobacteria bacterium]|nr:PAS-domain containing protein [Pseudomonadota bacterium]
MAAIALFFVDSPAHAAGSVSMPVALSLGGALAAAVAGMVYLYLALRASRDETARLSAADARLLDSAPAGLVRWTEGGASFSARAVELLELARDPGPVDEEEADGILRGALPEAEQEQLTTALRALHADGTGFEDRFRISGETSVTLRGDRLDGTDLVWVLDAAALMRLSGELDGKSTEAATLQALLDKIPLPAWWRSEDHKLAGVNRAYVEAADRNRETILANQIELAAGYIDQGGRALAERASKTGMAQSESHHVVIGSNRRLLEFTEVPLDGPVRRVGGFATDATALEALQDQLADHIAAHAEVLEGLGTAIAIFGADKRLKFFNTAYAELSQIDNVKLEGEPSLGEILEWLRENRRLPEYVDFPAFKADQDRWFTSLIDPVQELMHLPDETTLRFVASPHPLGGLVFALEDVTDRLALESSYNTLIEVQRETLNKLYEGVAVFGGDGRLRLFNPESGRIWGIPEEKLTGGPHISELVEAARGYFPGDADWPRLKQRVVLMVTERSAHSGRLHRKDGTVIKYAVVPQPDGNMLMSFVDISDSARVERALRDRNIALENADRIKSEFIGNVSYELRTPLNAIVGFTEILDNRYFGDLTERQSEYVECILQASTHLMALIDDILDLATIEAGYMSLDLQDVEIASLMGALAEVAAERADQAGLKIEIECPADIGTMLADTVRLRQALFNLVSNAIQFTPAGGTIVLSAERTDDEMLLSVTDTGIGIAPEDQERVFQRFERGDPNARESGTGLGLALVKSLIELHGGTVDLESTQGQGTKATCHVPLNRVPQLSENPLLDIESVN